MKCFLKIFCVFNNHTNDFNTLSFGLAIGLLEKHLTATEKIVYLPFN